MMSANWQKEQAELGSQISELSGKVEAEKENTSNARKWVELMKQYTDLQELTAPLLNALISKIVVHHPQKVEGGTMEQPAFACSFSSALKSRRNRASSSSWASLVQYCSRERT